MRYTGYQENKSRGTFGFPIQLYYFDVNHPQYEMRFIGTWNVSLYWCLQANSVYP